MTPSPLRKDSDGPFYCVVAKTSTAGRCTTVCVRFVHGGQHCSDDPRRSRFLNGLDKLPGGASLRAGERSDRLDPQKGCL